METQESIYGAHRPALEQVMDGLMRHIGEIRSEMEKKLSMDPVEHCLCRIKSEESMREKCRRNNLPETTDSALRILTDAVGLRIVCAFVDDVYTIRDYLKASDEYEVIKEKDYIRHAKPNGYRSYHMIIKVSAPFEDVLGNTPGEYFIELQLRTIAMDSWASLEHKMKYKKDIANSELIVSELKRCADELTACDVSMQTIRNMIMSE